MMIPFDQTGVPQQGQPPSMRPPMPPGHMQPSPSGVMQHGHPQPMNPPPYSHRPSGGMPVQPPHYMPPSPAQHQGNYNGGIPGNAGQYSSHPPLHQSQPPMHPMGHPGQMHHSQMNRQHSSNMGMPPMQQHDPMMNASQGHGRPPPPPQQYMGNQPPPPHPPPPSQPQAMGGGSWQSDRDIPHRREMIQHIIKLLKKDRSGSPESLNRLPQMAKHLEVSLYRNAPSFEAYVDMSTLKQRLHQIAAEVSRRSRSQNDSRRDDSMRTQNIDHSLSSFSQNGMRGGSSSPYMGGMSNGSMNNGSMNSGNMNNGSMNSGRMVNMEDINPMSSGGGGPQGYHQQPPRNDRMSQHQPPQQQQQQQQRPNPQSSAMQQPQGQNRNDPEWKLRIRHKQQRLLLLHHSAKCTHKGQCPVTPHCADMKRLWRHMEGCKDNQCRVPHCFSSRAILSHYRKCKDPACPACGPVRETVRKGQRSGSTANAMNLMRTASPSIPNQQPQQQLMQGADLGMGSSSFGGASVRSSSGHSVMPPPSANASAGNNDLQFSSQYRPSTAVPSNGQAFFGADQQSSDPRAAIASSSSNTSSLKDSASTTIPGGSRPPGSSESEWQKIRHKQQRLLLLRHASRCQYELGTCPVTPHCASMKKLWDHIAHCKDQQCKVQHCLTSRYVLSHYRRCKNARCPSCGPVRDSIRRSALKEKQQQGSHPQQQTAAMSSNLLDVDVFKTPIPSPPQLEPSPTESLSQPEQKRRKKEDDASEATSSTILVSNETLKVPSASGSSLAAQTEMKSQSAVPGKVASKSKDPRSADRSLLNSFTLKELETHLQSLDRKTQLPAAKLKSKCQEVLKGLQTHQHGWVFNCPVDPVELGLPDYFEIIKKPMDLGTIQKKIENGGIHSIEEFISLVHLTFDNAMTYNESESVVYGMAKELKTKFEADVKKLMKTLEDEDLQRRQNDRACHLCGCEKLLFEPPVYFCNGMNCPSQRIRRNNNFYIGGNNQYFWCSSCYNELDDKIPIELIDMTIMKSDLVKKRNDEVHEESWVQCDTCENWVHQICGLFNTRQNKEHHSEYNCPRCIRDKRIASGDIPYARPPGASDLPRTTLSEWLEQHIAKRIDKKKRQLAEDKTRNEGISMDDALKHVESGGPIIIRQVTAMDRKLEVRDLMRERYAHKNYPEEFPFRCKCIVVFQNLDGVDTILFALYVYEHGENNPPPNQRVVYISYLDSVHFMRPRNLRTFVYHEILIAYLDYARQKGFATAHIWACPPLRGDDYIFFAKPEDQKTPRDNRLRQWYQEMLIEAHKRGIVGRLTNMYDLYFANESLDATAVPYLEGDYFPGEAENIIKMLKEGKGKKAGNGGKKKKSKASKGTTGTRSTGVDEEALLASGFMDDAKTLKDLDRDQVMVKLGETIQPMKESFIVAFLNWSGAKEEDKAVPEAMVKARAEYKDENLESDLAGIKRDASGHAAGSSSESVKVIDDDEEDLDCEFLNNRQAFLNLCRGNHYQFDELRRSKHTSMMVLWHLHNRDAPKFVQQCVACSREILSGKRYHCNICPDYDLCQDCYKDPNVNRGNCTHTLVPIAVDPDANQERNGMDDAERQARQRNLMMHIQLIEHASGCVSKTCTSSNCAKMKNYLHHASICRVKVQGGCKICKKIWTLLRIHAQKCRQARCPIPQCNAIREKMRQLQKQQQAMDDRRRLEMNRHMRFGGATSS